MIFTVVLKYPCLHFSPVCSRGKAPGQCFPGTNYAKFKEASGDLIPIDFLGCLGCLSECRSLNLRIKIYSPITSPGRDVQQEP